MSEMTNGKSKRITFPAAAREEIAKAHNFTCHYCGQQGSQFEDADGRTWHIDHKHPISRGGSNEMSNLTLACRACNLRKGDTAYEEFIQQAPDLRQSVLQELGHFQKLVFGELNKDSMKILYRMNNSVDVEEWTPVAKLIDNDAHFVMELLQSVRRVYALANRFDDA